MMLLLSHARPEACHLAQDDPSWHWCCLVLCRIAPATWPDCIMKLHNLCSIRQHLLPTCSFQTIEQSLAWYRCPFRQTHCIVGRNSCHNTSVTAFGYLRRMPTTSR